MATVYIDDKAYEVDGSQNMLAVCLSLGLNLPYFCWHPALGSVGACRQCAVKQFRGADDKKGKLVMACLTPAAEGTRISIEDRDAVDFRAGIIQGLMQSHPHDCPVCDEGGECHLQDMTVMTGHDYRAYSFAKRTFRNQYLGPFVNHEMNRCIQCYRCVRFYRDYAGDNDLNAFGLRNIVYFGRDKDGVLKSEFSGNLVEVCPTGVFTDATLKHHYTRKWDIQFAPSICAHCGVGCNTSAGERYKLLRRIVNRYNGQVNGYFLCDRGRYGYEFVNSPARIRQPLLRQGSREGKPAPATREELLDAIASLFSQNSELIGIGSPRASLEANFALRTLVGEDRFYAGVDDDSFARISAMIGILRQSPARSTSLHDMELSDAVLVLGEDVTNTAPRVALALRQSVRRQPMDIARKMHIPEWLDMAVREAVQEAKGPLFVATVNGTRLDSIARRSVSAPPDDIARLGFAVAHAIDPAAPEVPGLSEGLAGLAEEMAKALVSAERPLVVSGGSCGTMAVIEAAANVANALCRKGRPAGLSLLAPECNSFGLAMMSGKSLGAALDAVHAGEADSVIILENDLFRRAPSEDAAELFHVARHVLVLDQLENDTTAEADTVVPAGTFAEADGTLVSSEGRAQRFFQVYVPDTGVQESWRWLRDFAAARLRVSGPTSVEAPGMVAWESLDDVTSACAAAIPELARITEAAPPASLRLAGEKVPREPHRYSGRTAMFANVTVHEPTPPSDPDSALAFSMEGYPAQPPSALIPFFWAPGWNSIQSTNFYQREVAGPLRGGDPGVRLIEPDATSPASYFAAVPEGFSRRSDEWLFVPLYHIFGSEELSNYSPPVAELIPKPYVLLRPDDAARIAVDEGGEVEVSAAGFQQRLPVRFGPDLPPGLAGIPFGITPFLRMPAWGRISTAL